MLDLELKTSFRALTLKYCLNKKYDISPFQPIDTSFILLVYWESFFSGPCMEEDTVYNGGKYLQKTTGFTNAGSCQV